MVKVHGDDPKPIIRVKLSATANFRRYGFVDAVLGLNPAGKLGLGASDYKVILLITWDCICLQLSVFVFNYSCIVVKVTLVAY